MRILPEGWCVAHSVPQQDMDENATLKTGGKVELTRQYLSKVVMGLAMNPFGDGRCGRVDYGVSVSVSVFVV